MLDRSPESPEERAGHPAGIPGQAGAPSSPPGIIPASASPFAYALVIVRRVGVGVLSDGFIHAGNLAYLALLTVFPFFILAAAIAAVIGQGADAQRAVTGFLALLPPDAAELLRRPIADVLAMRTGSLLWLGALVGLWSVASFVETIRDIFRRAYGVRAAAPFWHYRLGSMALIIASLVLALLSFVVQGAIIGVEQFIYRLLPVAAELAGWLQLSRIVPGIIMFAALYTLFLTVTPGRYRRSRDPKWPGALLTTLWWGGITALLPRVLATLGHYNLTYGSLAGVIITLIFFFLVGLGIVLAAHLNAALAEPPPAGVESPGGSSS